MIPAEQLADTLGGCHRDTLRAVLYRYVPLEHLATLTSTEAAWAGHNRYTAPGVSKALYAASTPDLAMLEATRHYQQPFGTPVFPAHAVFPLQVSLKNVLDLTASEHYRRLGTSLMELTGDWRAAKKAGFRVVTQELGEAAYAAGFSAIRYPSAYRPGEWNAVIFTEHVGSADDDIRAALPDEVLDSMELLTNLRVHRQHCEPIALSLQSDGTPITIGQPQKTQKDLHP